MAKSNTIELDRPVPKAASLRPFKDGDEVLIWAGDYEGCRATFWRTGTKPGTVTVYVHRWKSPAYDLDEDLVIHARR